MALKLQSELVNLVEDNDLVNFITEAYGLQKRYELVAAEELSNGDYKLFDVEQKPLSDYEQRQLDTFKATGNSAFVTNVVLQDLCNKGWLEPGKYLVFCCW